MPKHYLHPLFSPAAIALLGEATITALVRQNLIAAGFAGPIYRLEVDRPPVGAVDLAIIASPAAQLADDIRRCGEYRINRAIVVTAVPLEEQAGLRDSARALGLRLLGPGSIGLWRPAQMLNASFSRSHAQAGSLALVSQSAAICTALVDWAAGCGVGFANVVSVGDACDIGIGDVLDYLALDPATRGIVLHLEAVGDARRFLSGLRAAARAKPVVVVKAGASAQTAAAEAVFNAALARAGAVRVASIGQMFAAAQVLALPQRVTGKRLAIVSNAHGPALMAADAVARLGGGRVLLAGEGVASVLQHDASPAQYHAAVATALAASHVDGVLVLCAPLAQTQASASAAAIIAAANPRRKPLLACWLGGPQVAAARTLFAQQHIPSFASPDSAVDAFAVLAAYHQHQQLLLQTPGPLADGPAPDIDAARALLDRALAAQRWVLAAAESHAVLHAFHLTVADLPGPALHIRILTDAVFGPVIGVSVDGVEPGAIALPPLNALIVDALVLQLRLDLPPAERDALCQMLLRVSAMACELPQIAALHLSNGAARIDIRPTSAGQPYRHMAIHPYPSHLTRHCLLADATPLTLRPIRPEDADMEQAFVRDLSPAAKYFRFMDSFNELSRDVLVRFTQLDYARELAFVATIPRGKAEQMVGVARYISNPDGQSGEIGVVVADDWQGQGIGTRLMDCITDAARSQQFKTLQGEVLASNHAMLHLMAKLGFSQHRAGDDPGVIQVEKRL